MNVRVIRRGAIRRSNADSTTPPPPSESTLAAAERARLGEEARADAERVLAEARTEAERLLATAAAEVAQMLEKARADATAITESAARKGQDDAAAAARNAAETERASFAAAWLALRASEARADDNHLDRVAHLARVIAERLVGHALELDDTVAPRLARSALAELRDAKRVRLEAHPLDVVALRAAFTDAAPFAIGSVVVDVTETTECPRGSFLLHTDLGTAHADLHVRIERLAGALRDALRKSN